MTASTLTASVVVPSYGHESFVVEAVESALAEPVLEVVVVDDGSPDRSVEALAPLASEAPRLRLLTQENRGAHRALERGVEAAQGDIVFVLNSDDRFVPGRVARLSTCFDDPDVTWAATWLTLIDGAGATLGVKEAWHNMPPWPPRGPGPGLSSLGDPTLALLEANYVATTSNLAFRRARYGRASGLQFRALRYAHDWDFFLTACGLGRFELIPEPLVDYRVHGQNTIKEGQAAARTRGVMRFEALWCLARHRETLLRRRVDLDVEDLRRRAWSALPPWAPETLFAQLLWLRGKDRDVPAAYDALLDEGHPFREAAIDTLAAIADSS